MRAPATGPAPRPGRTTVVFRGGTAPRSAWRGAATSDELSDGAARLKYTHRKVASRSTRQRPSQQVEIDLILLRERLLPRLLPAQLSARRTRSDERLIDAAQETCEGWVIVSNHRQSMK